MPRQPRIVLEGLCYHVVSRGNQQQTVFLDEMDYYKYLKYLQKYKLKYNMKLYAWCLMNNHVHMALDGVLLSKMMHDLNLSYSQYFQFKYKKTGHVWQGRFKSYLLKNNSYMIDCINYIEYNPVRAKIVERPEEYKWSSYSARVLGKGIGKELLDPITF